MLLLLLGTAAFTGLALLLAGSAACRGDARRSPTSSTWSCSPPAASWCRSPATRSRLQPVLALLPVGALTQGLRACLDAGAVSAPTSALPSLGVLAAWAAVAVITAARTFRWE